MAASPKIRVMLSSRCREGFSADEPTSLTDIRRNLKQSIEGAQLFGSPPFEVWLNEDEPASDHLADSWDFCLKQSRDCDVMIVLYNGHAGWAKSAEDVGVCHAEYAEAVKASPAKVRLIELPPTRQTGDKAQRARNERFKVYQQQAAAFRGGEVTTIKGLIAAVHAALFDAVLSQARRGAEPSKVGRFDLGAALEWSRLDYAGRRAAMQAELRTALEGRTTQVAAAAPSVGGPVIQIAGRSVLVRTHAIPAAFSVPAAREPVGRPHLQDHELSDALKAVGGPLHVIACHRSVTETQATNMLGFPDATIVSSPFGVYVADDIQKVQFVFLANCRDAYQTRHAVQRFLDWTEQAGESAALAERAMARARIVKAIAKEQVKSKTRTQPGEKT